MKKFVFKSKWNIAILALLGVSLISAGVFASASISINGDSAINLGAGKAEVMACKNQATVSTHQEYNETENRYELTSITLDDLDTTSCVGKTLKMTLAYTDLTNGANAPILFQTSWSHLQSGTHTLTWWNDDKYDATNLPTTLYLANDRLVFVDDGNIYRNIDTANVGTAHIAISEE
jgi:hypothetical protein